MVATSTLLLTGFPTGGSCESSSVISQSWLTTNQPEIRTINFHSLGDTSISTHYTVFHKIRTPLYFFNNILPCGPFSIIDILNCSAENWLGICDTFTYLTFKYSLKIVTSHSANIQQISYGVGWGVGTLDEQFTFTPLIPALR